MSRFMWEKWILGALAVAVGYPVVKLALPIALPFFLAMGLALAAEPAVGWMHRRLHLPRSVAAGIGVTGVFLLTATLLTLLLTVLVRQLAHLKDFLPAVAEAISQGIALLRQWFLSLAENAPEGIRQTLASIIQALFQDGGGLLQQSVQKIPQMAGNALGRLSNGLIWMVTAVLAAFMISARLPQLAMKIPKNWRTHIFPMAKACRKTIGRWLLAQGKLSSVTLGLLSAGFLLLRLPHALLWAVLVTMVDILPILGVGTVLIPWSLVRFLQGENAGALGLLGLFGIVWLVRSVLEPKLIGKELGLDPLLTLLCIYAGFRLWGILGMLLAPLAAISVLQFCRFRQGREGA